MSALLVQYLKPAFKRLSVPMPDHLRRLCGSALKVLAVLDRARLPRCRAHRERFLYHVRAGTDLGFSAAFAWPHAVARLGVTSRPAGGACHALSNAVSMAGADGGCPSDAFSACAHAAKLRDDAYEAVHLMRPGDLASMYAPPTLSGCNHDIRHAGVAIKADRTIPWFFRPSGSDAIIHSTRQRPP